MWGAQLVVLRLAPFLEHAGFELVLAAPHGSELGERWRRGGRQLRVLEPDRPAPTGLSALGAAARTTHEVRRLLGREHPDLVLGNSYWGSLAAAMAARPLAIPSVAYLHEEVSRPHIRGITTRLATASIAVSRRIADDLTPAARRRNEVIANGVDTAVFAPGEADAAGRAALASHPNDPVVLYFGRLDPEKQVGHLIEAVASIPEPAGVQLAIVGSSALAERGYEEELRHLATHILGDRVRFLGRRDDLPDLLRNADAVAFTGRREGMSLALLEALATGCAIVAYPAAGVAEVVDPDITAAIPPMGDRAALSRELARVLGDGDLRRRLGREGRRRAETDFSLERQAEKAVELFERVIAGRVSP